MTKIDVDVNDNIHKAILKELVDKANKYGYTCLRGPRPSGALLITLMNHRIYGDVKPAVATPSCKSVGECMIEDRHCVRNLHAEVDALLEAAMLGISTLGGTMYSINKPCFNCAKACAKAGIRKIIYAYTVYDEERTEAVVQGSNIECMHVELD